MEPDSSSGIFIKSISQIAHEAVQKVVYSQGTKFERKKYINCIQV